MSDTPRTDADLQVRGSYFGPIEYVSSDFARQLERELAEARREIERLRAENSLMAAHQGIDNYQRCLSEIERLREGVREIVEMTELLDGYGDPLACIEHDARHLLSNCCKTSGVADKCVQIDTEGK